MPTKQHQTEPINYRAQSQRKTRGSGKQRKQRKVNNAYIEVDSVNTPPGENYSNWIAISKQLLKKRESVLLGMKINKIESLVNEARATYLCSVTSAYKVPETLIESEIFAPLYQVIDEWNGVNLLRLKKVIGRFRDYFVTAKNWWDLSKKKKIGDLFWMTILRHVDEYIAQEQQVHVEKKKESGSDGQGKAPSNVQMFRLQFMYGVFHRDIQYANTKVQPLINNSTISNCKDFHEYLFALDDRLNVQQWPLHGKHSDLHQRIKLALHDIIIQHRQLRPSQRTASTEPETTETKPPAPVSTTERAVRDRECTPNRRHFIRNGTARRMLPQRNHRQLQIRNEHDNIRTVDFTSLPLPALPPLPPLNMGQPSTSSCSVSSASFLCTASSSMPAPTANLNNNFDPNLCSLLDILNHQNQQNFTHHQMPTIYGTQRPELAVPVLPTAYAPQRGINYSVIALRHSPIQPYGTLMAVNAPQPAARTQFRQFPVSLVNVQYPVVPANLTFQ